jgi:putative transposase
MLLAHKIELRPAQAQAEYLSRACGSRRHCYNQLLAHFGQDGVKWSKAAAYQHYITVLRPQFLWYGEVSSRVTRNAIDDLDRAFKHFFRRVKTGHKQGKGYGFPKFKKKGINDGFALRERPKFDVEGRSLRIEKLATPIQMRQKLRFTGATRAVTISQRAGKFYASVLVETEDYNPHAPKPGAVGVDFGVHSLAVMSDGTTIPANQKLKANLRRLAHRQRRLSRKRQGSNRRAKAKLSVARLHKRIADQRQAVLHELSDKLTRTHQVVCIEDLNVRGMLKNRRLARAISDAGFGELRRMIEYKAELRGGRVVVIGRFEPTSKTCSECGQIHDMPLAKREMRCDCGNVADRDLNAARNILARGLDTLAPDLKRTQEAGKTGSPARPLTA